MRRLVLLMLAMVSLMASGALAADLTKQQIIKRSGPICSDLLDAIQPHVDKADDARAKQQWERFIQEGRKAISIARPYGHELRQLLPDSGARRYRRFLDHARAALNWLERGLDALENERMELAKSRQETAQRHFRRAKRAAERYGLRPSCIRVVD